MKKLLLHCCCGPCSTACIERLIGDYQITLFYFNPNIYPTQELEKRAQELEKVAKYFGVECIIDHTCIDFAPLAKGLENQREGGTRCQICFDLRLDKTAQYAKQNGFDAYATTLTVSPYKNSKQIFEVGQNISKKYDVPFLEMDFKKNDGYHRSIVLSKQLGLYRQNYCGCYCSLQNRQKTQKNA